MELSEEQLKAVEEIAAAAYSPREVAFQIGLNPSKFVMAVKDEEHPASMAYFKGFLSSEFSVRQSVMTLARNGSSPAQTLANQLFNDTRLNLYSSGFSFTEEG